MKPYRNHIGSGWAAVEAGVRTTALFAHVLLVPHVVQNNKSTMEAAGWFVVVGWLVVFLLFAAIQVRPVAWHVATSALMVCTFQL